MDHMMDMILKSQKINQIVSIPVIASGGSWKIRAFSRCLFCRECLQLVYFTMENSGLAEAKEFLIIMA